MNVRPAILGSVVAPLGGSLDGSTRLTSWKLCKAMPSCFRLLTHCDRRAASRAAWTAGNSSAIRTAMIAITTRSSMSVKPLRLAVFMGASGKEGGFQRRLVDWFLMSNGVNSLADSATVIFQGDVSCVAYA